MKLNVFFFGDYFCWQYDEDEEDELLEQQHQLRQQQPQQQQQNYALQPGAAALDKDSTGTISGMLADFSRSIGNH